ncbi:MAG: hypothetical protein Q8P99_00505 [bacterium]|nr:hypothetical protein [bacterium]
MTIVQPRKEANLIKSRALCLLGIGLMLTTVLLSYLSLVGLRHDLADTRESIEDMKVANAEFKNQYYSFTSNENLERLAGEMGLVKDQTPQWALASQR